MTIETTIDIKRSELVLRSDESRVLLRPFNPGFPRWNGIIDRIMAIPDEQVGPVLENVISKFSGRHRGVRQRCHERFEQVVNEQVRNAPCLSEQRRQLIGAYFLAEYSLEAAALFNPSIVPHPDQTGLPAGSLRFILSLRAVGEGHISSITFRTGILHGGNRFEIEKPAGFLTEPRQVQNASYEKRAFVRRIGELGLAGDFSQRVTGRLNDSFDFDELCRGIDAELQLELMSEGVLHDDHHTAIGIKMLAQSNYEVQFENEQELSSRILFPVTRSQSNGIEDARFVRFTEEDGETTYFATFTAYDGRVVMPELIETRDFLRFRFTTLNGEAAKNKGMALFPRMINGLYMMLTRQDSESLFLSTSDNVYFWDEHRLLLTPTFPWELIQIGNCGSPIETDDGWLVLCHGVGPLRQYGIGAFLLDRNDPGKVIGRLPEPILFPNEQEREGYVPNVVYTCGALIHDGILIVPYGVADQSTGFATAPIEQIIASMR